MKDRTTYLKKTLGFLCKNHRSNPTLAENFETMKTISSIKKVAFGMLVLFSLSISAQTPNQTKPTNTVLFEWTDMPTFSAMVNSSVSTSDGGWVVGGSTAAMVFFYYPPVVIKLSSSGEKLWQYPQYFEWEMGNVDVLKQANDGRLFASGWCMAGCDYGPGGTFLHKISQDGQVIWEKIFVTNYVAETGDVFESATGEIYVIGGKQMLKVSSEGDSLGINYYPMLDQDEFSSGLATDDFLLLGHWTGIFKTDLAGNLISIHTFSGPIQNIVSHENGFLFIAGHQLIRTDGDLNIVDQYNFSTIIPLDFQATVENNTYVIVGNNHILQIGFDLQTIADDIYEIPGNFEGTSIAIKNEILLMAGNDKGSANDFAMTAKTFLLDGTTLNPSVDLGIVSLRAENVLAIRYPQYPFLYDFRWDAFATIRNFGNDTITSAKLVSDMTAMFICGMLYYIFPQEGLMLLPGDSTEIALGEMKEPGMYFPNQTSVEYTWKMHTMLPNGFMDRNPANDEASITFLVDLTVGIDENPASQIKLFPNPASGFINIEMPANDGFRWVITSITGQEILNGSSHLENTKVDVSSLPDGLYFIEIQKDGRQMFVKKLLISG